ncbi:MAG: collagen-like protein, partial [Parachlamydiaceae bacterium]|nr:collagen-like protein [Parachlamydiaceae bacterium]
PVLFPQDGPTDGLITRTDPGTFLLPNIGTYMVQFQVSVTEPGQLIIALDSGSGFVDVDSSVVGRATGTSQIVGMSLITTTAANTLLQIQNPTGNSTALTITPLAGGTRPVSAHLVITQID